LGKSQRNPIEKYWGVLKKTIKQCGRIMEDIDEAITLALTQTQKFGQP
jgi:hypothetical protein